MQNPYELTHDERIKRSAELSKEIDHYRAISFQYRCGTKEWLINEYEVSKRAAELIYYFDWVDVPWSDIIKHLPCFVHGRYNDGQVRFQEKHIIVQIKDHIRKGEKYKGFYCKCKNSQGKPYRVALIKEEHLDGAKAAIPWEEAKFHGFLPHNRTVEQELERVKQSHLETIQKRSAENFSIPNQ